MSKNFNNNTNNNDNSINLQIASLNSNLLTNYPTNTAIASLLASTVQSQTTLRDSAISTSLASANLFTNTSLSNYSSTILTNTAISNAINLNNTSNIAYTNSKIITEISRADLALSNAIVANNLLYTPSTNIGVGSQFNSISIGPNVRLFNGFSTATGNNATCSSYSCAYGYNSGLGCTLANSSCNFFGSMSGITVASSFTNSTAIGNGSIINQSNQIMLGDVSTSSYCANIITPNLTSTIHNANLQIISYNTLPLFLSQKYIGFMSSSLSLKSISAFNTYLNLASIAIIPGVFLIQFQINYNYSIGNMLSWWSFGVGTTATNNLDIQACKSYCSSSSVLPFSVSNSYMFTASVAQTIYLNTFISDFDNTNLTIANLSNFSIAGKLTICRIA